MCKLLKLPRSSFYYKPLNKPTDSEFENAVIDEFHKSRNNYGARKVKIMLEKHGIHASKRRICKIMKKYDLISNYTFKLRKTKTNLVNNDDICNVINCEFNRWSPLEVVVSDLAYVNVAGKWNYICVLLDLSNRQIIGSAVGKSKSAQILKSAFFSVKSDLRRIKIFHTDRGSEFKNDVVEVILDAFGIDQNFFLDELGELTAYQRLYVHAKIPNGNVPQEIKQMYLFDEAVVEDFQETEKATH